MKLKFKECELLAIVWSSVVRLRQEAEQLMPARINFRAACAEPAHRILARVVGQPLAQLLIVDGMFERAGPLTPVVRILDEPARVLVL